MTQQRTAALLEVLGIYLAGQLVTMLLIRALHVELVNPLDTFTAGITNSQLLTAARQLFVVLAMQYAGLFLLIIPINWWHRRRGPAAYGLTMAGRSWTTLMLIGVATVATVSLVVWPATTLILADATYHLGLGETVPWRQAFFDTSWRRWEFWVFSGVLSWVLIPVVEELFFRGYCQRRLAEDWGDGPAIIGTAMLFTFAHSQYLTLNVYNVCTAGSLLMLALGFGIVFAWTRSLIPSMVAHALINIPMTPFWGSLLLVAYVVGGFVLRRRALAVVARVFSGSRVTECVGLGVVGVTYAVASERVEGLLYAATAMLLLALGLEAMDRSRERRARMAEPPSAYPLQQ